MSNRVSEQALDFDSHFAAELIQAPVTNRAQMDVLRHALREAIQSDLTPRQREILLLYYYNRKNGRQIADELGITASTVCRTRKRAEACLRRALRFYMDYLNCGLHDDV